MSRIQDARCYNFIETLTLLKYAEPYITPWGSKAMRNGTEVRTLNECVQAMQGVLDYYAERDENVTFGSQYRLSRYWKRIERINTATDGIASQQSLFTRISYYVRGCLSCFFGRPVEKATEILRRATNMSISGDEQAAHFKRIGYRTVNDNHKMKLLEKATKMDCSDQLNLFIENFNKLVPKERRSLLNLSLCLWMEFIAETARSSNLTQWGNFLNEGITTVDLSPQTATFLQGKVIKWCAESGQMKFSDHPWYIGLRNT